MALRLILLLGCVLLVLGCASYRAEQHAQERDRNAKISDAEEHGQIEAGSIKKTGEIREKVEQTQEAATPTPTPDPHGLLDRPLDPAGVPRKPDQ